MLEKLLIRNFQCHEKITVDFDPAVTTVVGPSDRGKSAVLRAIRWLAFNRPAGDAFIKHGAGRVSVRLRAGGRDILRERAAGSNLYKIDGKEFQAFGSDVPPEIVNALNLDAVNFQRQLDPVFWFSKSPGEVSRELNAIIDLGLIDRTLSNLASASRRAKAGSSPCGGPSGPAGTAARPPAGRRDPWHGRTPRSR